MDANDLVEIYNLMSRYGHAIDDGAMGLQSFDALDKVFTPDAIFDMNAINCGEFVGVEAIKTCMKLGTHPIGHHVTNLLVDQKDASNATCRMKLIVILADGRSSTGTYMDQLVRTVDGWRIKHRAVTIRPFDQMAELPVFATTG